MSSLWTLATREYLSGSWMTYKNMADNDQRVHKCTMQNCKIPGFKKPSDLRRHQRSHEAPRFFCPMTTCSKHLRGFKRKDGLTQHQKRIHGTNSHTSVATPKCTARASSAASREDENMEGLSPVFVPAEMKNGLDIDLSPKDVLLAKLAE